MENKKNEYIIFCSCIEDELKYKHCKECPHFDKTAMNISDSCQYEKIKSNN